MVGVGSAGLLFPTVGLTAGLPFSTKLLPCAKRGGAVAFAEALRAEILEILVYIKDEILDERHPKDRVPILDKRISIRGSVQKLWRFS